MSDVATLIDRLEGLRDGEPIPGDEEPMHGATRGFYLRNTAQCRTMVPVTVKQARDHVPARLACELYDNLDTILAALRYWRAGHSSPPNDRLRNLLALADETLMQVRGAFPLDPGPVRDACLAIRRETGDDYTERRRRALLALEQTACVPPTNHAERD